LGTGQAFITVLNEKGIPTETVVTHLAPPSSFMGPLTAQEYQSHLDNSDMYKKYKETVDPRSAFEMLDEKMQSARKEEEKQEEIKQEEKNSSRTSTRKEKSTLDEVLASPVTKQIGRELVRGVFGMLFGSAPRRTTTRRRY
jgi:hypothetical protein